MTHVLVAGGAGYIGSHMVKRLGREGFRVTTLDNLVYGHRDAVLRGDFVHADLLDRDALSRVFAQQRFDLVMHFAAFAYVGESVQNPRKYWVNNLVGSINLLNAMMDAGVSRLIFSSTCAVYGLPDQLPITEDHPERPVSPYGKSKIAVERAITDYAHAYGLSAITLRYFNASGADREGDLDERHDPETHLIPLVLREAERVQKGGEQEATALTVLGDDYPTRDGTCVRDYVHVEDITAAHLAAAERALMGRSTGHEVYNLGTEHGTSVREVIDAARDVTGVDFTYRVAPRRAGDPATLIASAARAREVLGFSPEVTAIRDIVASAWRAGRKDRRA